MNGNTHIETPDEHYHRIAPRIFIEGDSATDVNHKDFRRDAYERAMAWNPSTGNLLLYGATGTCKTRILWLLLRRLIVAEKFDVEVLSNCDFRGSASEAHRVKRIKNVTTRLAQVPILAWDDFGMDWPMTMLPAPLSCALDASIFGIIDYRYSEGLPVIIATPFTPSEIAARLSGGNPAREEVCASIVRRIIERCEIVEIGGQR